ncbi:MAG: hypothetical protein M3P18_20975 [Actinomycetota bacterium]|nr:hypothetical protein [Actinomycetota bacterium]
MKFIQTIAYTTSKAEEIRALSDQFREAGTPPGAVSIKVLKDRERENAYLVIAEFESYELAMQNSARPETDAFAQKMAALVDGPPAFGNYDVVEEETP